MSNIGENLKILRENKFLSQKSVSKLTGISNKTLSVYERNKAEPDIKTMVLLADFYDVSLDALVGREIHDFELAPKDIELLNIIKKLNSNDKQVLKDIAKNFLNRYNKKEKEEKL